MSNKIYARIDDNDIVIKFFSSVFEVPLDTDILIEEGNEAYHAHVQLKYEVVDEQGNYNYKYANNKLIKLTDKEKEELNSKKKPNQKEETTEEKIQKLEEHKEIMYGALVELSQEIERLKEENQK